MPNGVGDSIMNWSQDDDPHGVRKLLALLRTNQDKIESNAPLPQAPQQHTFETLQTHEPPKAEDVRYISFAQALPHLTRLSKDEAFLAALLRLKSDQDQYEELLSNERIEFSKSKGSDPSSQSALTSWDREALRRWDNLHQEQQRRLQALGVPCFFETKDPSQLKKQERVFDVLHGLLE